MGKAEIFYATRTPIDTLEKMGKEGHHVCLYSVPYSFEGDFSTANKWLRKRRIEDVSNERLWTVVLKPRYSYDPVPHDSYEFDKETNLWKIVKKGRTRYVRTPDVITVNTKNKDKLNVDDLYTVKL